MDDKTWIDQPSPVQGQQQPQQQGPPPPQMPPPPPPPGSGGGGSRLLIYVVVGIIGVVLCGVIGFFGYQLFNAGALDIASDPPDSGELVSDADLTQTALVGAIESVQTDVIETATPEPPTETPLPPSPTPEIPTETPTETVEPTDTVEPTPSVPTYTASQGINCRQGPSTIYQEVRSMNAGETLPILGKSTSPVDGVSIWYQVEIGGLRCFVSSGFGTTEGNLENVPSVPPPPTPTPTPTFTPTNTPTATPTP